LTTDEYLICYVQPHQDY